MIFQLACPACSATFTTTPDVFDGIDFRRRDEQPFEVRIDRRPPSIAELLTEGPELLGPHPLRESLLPVVALGCPSCDAEIDVALGLFVVDPSWRERASVGDDLVGQRRFEVVGGPGLTDGGRAALDYSIALAKGRREEPSLTSLDDFRARRDGD